MIGLRQFLYYIVALFFVVGVLSCAESSVDVDAENETGDENTESSEIVVEDQVYYQVPSPHEMMEFIKLGGTEFHAEVLCSTEIYNRYVDLKGRSMGMGIYIADLAYASSFSRFQESMLYFNVIVKMADEIGIGSVFDEKMLNRMKSNLDHSDSLEIISNESYYKIINDLEKSDRGKVVAMIAAGGFLESMYISTQLVKKFDKKDPLIQRIADQKLVYENLMAYLDKYKDDQNVEWAINDMSLLTENFKDVSDNSRETKFTQKKGGKKVLGGVGGVYITEAEFEDLKYQVAFLRNTMTFNPPARR